MDWLYQSGCNQLFPDRWEDFISVIPPGERAAPPEAIGFVEAYRRRLIRDDGVEIEAARAWARWEDCVGGLFPPDPATEEFAEPFDKTPHPTDQRSLALARIENHFFSHGGFFEPESQLLDNIDKIRHSKPPHKPHHPPKTSGTTAAADSPHHDHSRAI